MTAESADLFILGAQSDDLATFGAVLDKVVAADLTVLYLPKHRLFFVAFEDDAVSQLAIDDAQISQVRQFTRSRPVPYLRDERTGQEPHCAEGVRIVRLQPLRNEHADDGCDGRHREFLACLENQLHELVDCQSHC